MLLLLSVRRLLLIFRKAAFEMFETGLIDLLIGEITLRMIYGVS